MIRTFIALEMGPEVRRRAEELIGLLCNTPAKVSWTKPHNMHLTVKFLGDTAPQRIAEVVAAVASVAAETAPLNLALRGAGVFPDVRRPQTLWVGVDQGHDEVCRLAAAIDQALWRRGFPKEKRPFQPHLTLGRVRQATSAAKRDLGKLVSDQQHFDCGLAEIPEVLVMSSQLGPAGPAYEVLQSCSLTGSA